MNIEITVANKETGFIIKNMYPLYLHDLAGIHGTLPNEYGIFEEGEVKTLQEEYDIQQIWFEHPEVLFPYLLRVDGIPAGFCLVGSGRYVPKGIDYYIYEMFLLSPFRGKGIGEKAVLSILNKHHGKWMLFTQSTENNKRAQMFWNKVLTTYTDGTYDVKKEQIDGQPKLVYTFEK
ncbi:GNAT family N-acetyltransferase [Anaerosporobacter faecicola]|uniref:GNAT family N-acetyltransferase n=1 Tax=Anaerosporobacter faecicola TaxID=2718714 RepID=UPI00143B4656|nr:GNAT family N-acetyltransferase [Anaerosporobacter faecicola]